MKSDLWVVIVVTAAFIGFLMGYSLPPLVETGMLTGKGKQAKKQPALEKDTKQYYRGLYED
ncbi:MAG TPA: hypothetical protein ENG78_07605 [Acidiferrobacteraceae bacterium]|jgi:hypothetical protein|nr:hypothetical protein [Acidiferrobacteraceae bacterium]HEX20666.1 hypothetical protein [Acidiferrobacteraceae bacterium]